MTATAPVRTPEGARWSCRSCGDCCRGFEFGPVEPDIIAGLEARDVAAHWPPAADGPWYERRTAPDGRQALFLTHRDGHCVFLRADSLCAVHALWGAAAKPAFCREYPFHVVEDPGGLVVIARSDCGGLHESWVDGDPVADQVDDVLALPSVRPRRVFRAEQVLALLPELGISGADWMRIEPIVLRDVSVARPPWVMVADLRDRFYDLCDRTATSIEPPRYRAALRVLIEVLHRSLGTPTAAGDYRERLIQHVAQAVARAHAAIDAPIDLADDAVAYLALVLRSKLLAKQFLAVGGVPFALGQHLLVVEIAARAAGTGPLHARDVGPTLARFERLAAHPAFLALLKQGRSALADLFLHAG